MIITYCEKCSARIKVDDLGTTVACFECLVRKGSVRRSKPRYASASFSKIRPVREILRKIHQHLRQYQPLLSPVPLVPELSHYSGYDNDTPEMLTTNEDKSKLYESLHVEYNSTNPDVRTHSGLWKSLDQVNWIKTKRRNSRIK